jgi:hypothetical protein
MKHGNIFWGVTLIIIGFIFLLDKLGVIYFEWGMFWRLWPVLLILWGIAIMPINGLLKTLFSLLVAALTIGFYYQKTNSEGFTDRSPVFRFYDRDENNDEGRFEDQYFAQEMPEGVTNATLKLDAAAGEFRLEGTTAYLFEFAKSGKAVSYSYKVEEFENEATVHIQQETDLHLGRKNKNEVSLMLNPDPVWDMDIDIGAADFRFDMRNFKVNTLDIDGGATSIKLYLGELHPECEVDISAAASSIEVNVPETAGCRVEGSSVLSSRSLEGFNKLDKGIYETEGYETAAQKITIKVDAAVSSFTVKRN